MTENNDNSIPSEQKVLRLQPIDEACIDSKIEKYKGNGHTLKTMKESLLKELYDFEWTVIRCQVQIQSFKEQINYLERKISSGEE